MAYDSKTNQEIMEAEETQEELKYVFIGHVEDAQVNDSPMNKKTRIRPANGLLISVLTDYNAKEGDYLKVAGLDVPSEFFEVFAISIEDEKLLISAKEVGYHANKLGTNKDFDIRHLIGKEVRLVTDDEWKKSINTRSCWC